MQQLNLQQLQTAIKVFWRGQGITSETLLAVCVAYYMPHVTGCVRHLHVVEVLRDLQANYPKPPAMRGMVVATIYNKY